MGIMVDINVVINYSLSFILGIISAALVIKIQDRLSRYPNMLFKTHCYDEIPYVTQEFGKPIILHAGISKHFLSVSSKKTCKDIHRIGIRPQVNKVWFKRWLRNYNHTTENIAFNDRNYPPICIKAIKDITPNLGKNYDCDGDDGACGKFGYYKPKYALNMIPGQQIVYEIDIEAFRAWKGFIDFRIDTSNGMRLAHHPCEIK